MIGNEQSVVVENLTKRFGTFVAVDSISFQAHRGEIFGFLGPNGAGKSTTIRILCGLLRPTSGRASVAGIDVAAHPEAVRQQIGYMSQKFSLYNDLKVAENLRFFAGLYSVPAQDIPERMAWALRMAGLEGTGANPHARPGRRLETAAGAGVRGAASPAHRFSRRADVGRRSRLAPAVLGIDPAHGQRRHHGIRHHALHGRGGILQPLGADRSRAHCGHGHAHGTENKPHERPAPARGMRTARAGPRSAAPRSGRARCSGLWEQPPWSSLPMPRPPYPESGRSWRRGGLRVGRLEQIPPSLEDVFVALTAARESKPEQAV